MTMRSVNNGTFHIEVRYRKNEETGSVKNCMKAETGGGSAVIVGRRIMQERT